MPRDTVLGPGAAGTIGSAQDEPSGSCGRPAAGNSLAQVGARDERGQTSVEYIGLVLLVVVLIGAIAAFGIAGSITGGIRDALCTLTGTRCETTDGGARAASAQQLAAREQRLADLAGRGATYSQLLAEARAARQRGDLAAADRILDRLELYQRLIAAERGDLVDSLVSGTDGDFDALAARDTIDRDGSNRRYFRIPPSPGDGIVAMDYFIPADNSLFLKGDGRDTEDPLLGNAGLDRSRVVVILDRETGRGVIYQSQTCTVSAPAVGAYCEKPRPIALRRPRRRPQINPIPGPQAPSEYDLQAGDGSLELTYDVLNSVTPVGISVDGTVRLERGGDGFYEVTRDTRDTYPRIVIGQYRPGEGDKIIHESDDDSVLVGAPPPILRPSCDNPILRPVPILC